MSLSSDSSSSSSRQVSISLRLKGETPALNLLASLETGKGSESALSSLRTALRSVQKETNEVITKVIQKDKDTKSGSDVQVEETLEEEDDDEEEEQDQEPEEKKVKL